MSYRHYLASMDHSSLERWKNLRQSYADHAAQRRAEGQAPVQQWEIQEAQLYLRHKADGGPAAAQLFMRNGNAGAILRGLAALRGELPLADENPEPPAAA